MKYNEDRVKKQYWIDRNGRSHFLTGIENENIVSIHYQIAAELFPQIKHPNDPENYVERLGWVKMGSSVYHVPIIYNKNASQKQLDRLFDLGLLNELTVLEK